jgi:hypothetical protein
MYRGLSLSRCITDIAAGKVDIEHVETIVSMTTCRTAADWSVFAAEQQAQNWKEDPGACEGILIELLKAGKIQQPGLDQPSYFPDLEAGFWIVDGVQKFL